jgi:hypothetical protein
MPPFEKGQSGNPAGRPPGARNRMTMLMEEMFDSQAEPVIRKVLAKAMTGDATAMRLCLDRMVPARRSRPAPFELPRLTGAGDAAQAAAAVVTAAAEGALTPQEAAAVAKVIDVFARTRSAADVEERLTALERMVNV